MADLNELLKGTVEGITVKLATLSVAELGQLHDLEKKGASRTTLLSAIDRELDGRDQQGGEGGEQGASASTAKSGGTEGATNTGDKDGVAATGAEQTFTRAQVDQMLAEQQARHAEALKLAKAEAAGEPAPSPAPVKPRGPLVIDARADHPALAAFTGVTVIVFVDDADRAIDGLPPMPFGKDDFTPSGETATLKREVDFPAGLSPVDVAAAFLIDDEDDVVGKATLVQPFPIGGGRSRRLASNTLQFGR